MVNELGEARYLRKLRGQSELWNVVEAILLGLICAAFTARMIGVSTDTVQVSEGGTVDVSRESPYRLKLCLVLTCLSKNLAVSVRKF